MYLKRLEIQGFKSFPEKIKLEFNKGITAVVGPNGSGKSNISDAVRWVLGEQSVKTLRGSKMEDVIFSGTQNRKPLGFAEVSMIIDNSDKKLSIEFNEITVTRRVYRSGESDFLINGCSCRLKDIHELFMDTGIGKEGYSIIGQGRIDEILSTKSEDRRMLFEEAVGIVKFKNRKREAEDKLQKEKNNLVRVNDIIIELESQLSPLKLQAEKTKQYISLSDELKTVKVNIFVNEIENSEKQLENININLNNIENQIKDKELNQENTENKCKNFKLELSNLDSIIEDTNNELTELRSKIEQAKNDIKLLEQEIQYILNDIQRLNTDIEKNKQLASSKKEEIEIFNTKLNALKLEFHTKNEKLIEMQEDFDKLNIRMSENEELIDKYNTDIIEKIQLTSDIKSNIQRTNSVLEQLKKRKEQVNNELLFCESQLKDKNAHLEALNKKKKDICNSENNLLSDNEILVNKCNNIENIITQLKSQFDDINKSINESNSKYRILSELESDYEGYYGSVKSILKQKNQNNIKFSGICGAIGEIIEVPQKYETAIEIALGGSVQNIVTKNEKDAQYAIEYLKQNKKGRATFLPIVSVKGKSIDESKEILNENCIVGVAKDLITYLPEYENVISSLLGKVIVVDTISNAINISKKYNYMYKIVTLDGEVINTGGSLTGGSISKKSTGIFSRTREIKALKKQLEALNNQLESVSININSSENQLNDLHIVIDKNKENLHKHIIEKNDIDNKVEQTTVYINELLDKSNYLNIESKQLDEQLDNSENMIDKYNNELNEFINEINEVQNSLDEYQNSIQLDKNIKDEKNKELTDIKININEIKHNIASISSDITRISKEIKSVNSEIDAFSDNIKQNENKESEKINRINSLKVTIEEFDKAFSEKKQQFNNLNDKKSNLNENIQIIESDIKNQYEDISLLKNEETKLRLKNEQIEARKNQLCDEIWDEYELTYISAKDYKKLEHDIVKLNKEEKILKLKIKELGNINIDAVEEYKNIKERYEFLSEQRNDILDAEKKLKNIISELSKMMEIQFKEQFKIISDNFNKVFIEMFGGGTAYLKLSEENDVLNSGIDIIAQPPGKNIQSMLLMSGGERALTAISLLFAILIMKPSPFCILDEIEAALDDANVNRYAEFLKNFSSKTQFIIITHRKGTMESADILYGVTMQEQGVSKLVSVKFSDKNAV